MQDFIHFIGIGGIGVSALAHVALARGARVSGSDSSLDTDLNPALARLIEQGATCYGGHRREHVAEGVSLVVATAAVGDDNAEIVEARARSIPVVCRAEYLGKLMNGHRGPTIAVAGTHGKTTTTAMIGVMLQHAGLDPTVFVGGEVAQLGGNVRIGSADGPFIAEACEAYDSFLYLHPDIAVVTNVEADHLDHYGTEEGVFDAFRRFLEGTAEGGTIVACGDDPGVQRLLGPRGSELRRRALLYGTEPSTSQFVARSLELGPQTTFTVAELDEAVRLRVPGRHNVLNALAAAATCTLLKLPAEHICAGLEEFRGTERRQETLGEVVARGGSALVIDDYAHHPTEIRATLEALRGAYPERRQIVIFQPHLYSRTRDFLSEFGAALSSAAALIVTEVYAARERPIEGVTAGDIVEIARRARPGLEARYIEDRRAIPAALGEIVQDGDLVVFMGAGNIREQGEEFVKRYSAAAARPEGEEER